MAKVRFIGDEPREVPWLGIVVQPDQVVDVPDAHLESYVCQVVWQAVAEPKSTAVKRGSKDGD